MRTYFPAAFVRAGRFLRLIKSGAAACLPVLLLAAAFPVRAQEWKALTEALSRQGKMLEKRTHLSVSRKLERAYAATDALAPRLPYDAKTVSDWSFRVQPGYDSFLWAAALRNNRVVLRDRLELGRAVALLRENAEAVKAELQWAAYGERTRPVTLIRPSARYVFVGEVHNRPAIEKNVLALISQYRARFPRREVVLLSEFASDAPYALTAEDVPERVTENKRPLFEAFLRQGVRVFGLEEDCARQWAAISMTTENGWRCPLPGTPLAVEIRNRHWIRRVREFRRQYPDAVFFIYGGAGHTEYNLPHAVSAAFAPEETFVLSFFTGERIRFFPFDQAFEGQFSGPGVWSWKNPRWARLAGFDAAVVLPD